MASKQDITTSRTKKDGAGHALLIPVDVLPGAKPSPQKGNLTGIPRKIRDNCAEFYNLIQEWKTLNIQGLGNISAIAEKKLQETSGTDEDGSIQDGTSRRSPDQVLIEQCESLHCVYQDMVTLTEKMMQIVQQFRHVEALQTMQNSVLACLMPDNSSNVFQTWPAKTFWETSALIASMFLEEIQVKGSIIKSVAHVTGAGDLLFLLALWVHEPMIKPELTMYIEAMLVETGHRQ